MLLMTRPRQRLLGDPDGQPQEYYLAPEKLIAGNPKQTVWMQYTDSSGQFLVGIWESEAGKWSVSYTEEEYFQVLEGRSVITADDGHAVEVCAGESMVIARGFEGTWEVLEPTRKTFVIYEPSGN
jgi:uncharacterized protein